VIEKTQNNGEEIGEEKGGERLKLWKSWVARIGIGISVVPLVSSGGGGREDNSRDS